MHTRHRMALFTFGFAVIPRTTRILDPSLGRPYSEGALSVNVINVMEKRGSVFLLLTVGHIHCGKDMRKHNVNSTAATATQADPRLVSQQSCAYRVLQIS